MLAARRSSSGWRMARWTALLAAAGLIALSGGCEGGSTLAGNNGGAPVPENVSDDNAPDTNANSAGPPRISAADAARHVEAARQRLGTGRPESALRLLERVFAAERAGARAFAIRGATLHRLGDLELARADLDHALRLNERLPFAWCALGQLMVEQRLYADAVAALTRALDLDRRSATALQTRARAWQGLGEYGREVADHDALVNLAPGDPVVRYHRALARRRAGDEDGFADDLARVTAYDPAPVPALITRARLVADSDLFLALDLLGRALYTEPAEIDALHLRGELHVREHEWQARVTRARA